MGAVAPPPQLMTLPGTTAQPKFDLGSITKTATSLPTKDVIYGEPGWGKTSLAAQFSKPLFVMAEGEMSGLTTLISYGQIEPVDHIPEPVDSWEKLLSIVESLIENDHDYKTIVFDAINGFEMICFKHVRDRDFKGSQDNFQSYAKGYEVARQDWKQFLLLLDRLQYAKKIKVILLNHRIVKPAKDPMITEEYDRFQPDMHPKLWGETAKWADNIFFGGQLIQVDSKKRKATGSNNVLFVEGSAAVEAKNRIGLTDMIFCGNTPKETHSRILEAIKKAKEGNNK